MGKKHQKREQKLFEKDENLINEKENDYLNHSERSSVFGHYPFVWDRDYMCDKCAGFDVDKGSKGKGLAAKVAGFDF